MVFSVAFITGGASGLGEQAARRLSKEGYKIAIADLNSESGEKLAQELGNSIFIKLDVTNEQQVEQAIAATVKEFGAIHLVLNCAGIVAAQTIISSKGVASTETMMKVFKINVAGTFNVCKYAAKQISTQEPAEKFGGKGVLINVASVAGIEGQNGQCAYSASKGAIIGMTVPMARDLGRHSIRVITIAPGIFETPMAAHIPKKVHEAIVGQCAQNRLGQPEEFGDAVFLLAQSTFLNGEVVRLDGCTRLPKL